MGAISGDVEKITSFEDWALKNFKNCDSNIGCREWETIPLEPYCLRQHFDLPF